jgi:hypothetical protein
MSIDSELESWRREWQLEARALPELASTVRRQSRYMKIMLAAEVLITLVIGGGALAWAVQSAQPDVVVLAAAVWVFLAAAWTFGSKNRKDCWRPAAMSTSAFLDISIRRCRAGVASARFGTVLYFCELLFCTAWVYRHKSLHTPVDLWVFLTSPALMMVWGCTVAFVVGVVWYRRRKRSELSYLLNLRNADDAIRPHATELPAGSEFERSSGVYSRLRAKRKKGFGKV